MVSLPFILEVNMTYRKLLKAMLIAKPGSQQGAVKEMRELYPYRKVSDSTISLLIRGWLNPTPEIVKILESYTGKDKADLCPNLFNRKIISKKQGEKTKGQRGNMVRQAHNK